MIENLAGPPDSGKTTVARLFTAKRERAVHLESDLFYFIASGYIEPWKPESHEQNTIVMHIVADVASRYGRGGYFTVINVIVSPRRELYPRILEDAGLRLESRLRRHVNRRTGRRAGEFFEDVLVARVS